MKKFTTIFKTLCLSLSLLFVSMIIGSANVTAATDPSGPVFNKFTNVEGIGDERDFLRVQKTDGSRVNTIEQCDGEVTLWFYVHNSQAAINNGVNYTGPAPAKNTNLKVQIPTTESKAHTLTGIVSASNAATVSDTASITCNGSATTLDYLGANPLKTNAPEGYTLTGDLASPQGANLSLNGYPGGLMPGCWDHRISVTFKVKVTKKVIPPVSTAVCKLNEDTFIVTDKRKVTLTVSADVSNATVLGYEINWGDGSAVSTKQTDSHQYQTEKDATYKIQARVQVRLADGTVKWVDGAGCAKTLNFKGEKAMCTIPGKENLPADSPECKETPVKPPVTPPSGKLPDTGAGNLFGIFTAVSMVGAFLHKRYTARKSEFNL